MANKQPSGRIPGVELARLLAAFLIVAIHCTPFEFKHRPVGTDWDAATLVNQLARFAVPFFFTIAGYLWAAKLERAGPGAVWASTRPMAWRIARLFALWSLIYLLPFDIAGALTHGPLGPLKQMYWTLLNSLARPLDLLLGGTEIHLWFLPALLMVLLISAFFVQRGWHVALLMLALGLYLMALFGKPYATSPWGWQAGFNLRNGPFFGLLFFVGGQLMCRYRLERCSPALGASILCAGLLLQFFELSTLNRLYGINMAQDFVLATVPVGLGSSLLALSLHQVGGLHALVHSGRLALGIYASHLLLLRLLAPLEARWAGEPLWDLACWLSVYLGAWALSLLLARFRLSRSLVS